MRSRSKWTLVVWPLEGEREIHEFDDWEKLDFIRTPYQLAHTPARWLYERETQGDRTVYVEEAPGWDGCFPTMAECEHPPPACSPDACPNCLQTPDDFLPGWCDACLSGGRELRFLRYLYGRANIPRRDSSGSMEVTVPGGRLDLLFFFGRKRRAIIETKVGAPFEGLGQLLRYRRALEDATSTLAIPQSLLTQELREAAKALNVSLYVQCPSLPGEPPSS